MMSAVLQPVDQGTRRHLITVPEYHDSWERGHLPEHVELIEGVIYEMPPIGKKHAGIVDLLAARITKLLDDNKALRNQNPIQLDNFSEPEPDICILNKPYAEFIERIPEADDVILIIEVSDTTLQHDLNTKARNYAKNGIQRYWVIDINENLLYDHQDPHTNGYKGLTTIAITSGTEIEVQPGLIVPVSY